MIKKLKESVLVEFLIVIIMVEFLFLINYISLA